MASTLKHSEKVALKAAIYAETDATLVGYRNAYNWQAVMDWYNGSSGTKAWMSAATRTDYDDGCAYAAFSAFSAGARDSWRLFIEVPRDFSRQKTRKWITDIWGAATANSDAEGLLQQGTRNALRGEMVFGSNSATTGTVTAVKLTREGALTVDDVMESVRLGV